jgi:hypothetical protein
MDEKTDLRLSGVGHGLNLLQSLSGRPCRRRMQARMPSLMLVEFAILFIINCLLYLIY